jgi:DNA polymerase III subunit epsilon
MRREIILDTETTGLNPLTGDRIIEIAAIEIVNYLPTGKEFHQLVNPECPINPQASAVHNIYDSDVADKPLMKDIIESFLAFIEDAPLVIHNAEFDMGFLNAEFARLKRPLLPVSRAIDTLQIARRRFPGAPASLDALCRRFKIDLTARSFHSALLDCQLLAGVYLELMGGRQPDLVGNTVKTQKNTLDNLKTYGENTRNFQNTAPGQTSSAALLQKNLSTEPSQPPAPKMIRAIRPHSASLEEKANHRAAIALIKNPLWQRGTDTTINKDT